LQNIREITDKASLFGAYAWPFECQNLPSNRVCFVKNFKFPGSLLC